MQDRFAGDVGDFGKFSLLKNIFPEDSSYRLGIVWYLFPDEGHSKDGRHIGYSVKEDYCRCDAGLCGKLGGMNADGDRSVAGLESLELLPKNPIYYSDRLDFHLTYPTQSQVDKSERKERRRKWLKVAVKKMSDRNALFLDPDNGLEIDSCKHIHQIKSGKFAYYCEVNDLFKGKDVCVIYHHLNRHKKHGTHENQVWSRIRELRCRIEPSGKIFGLRFWPYSPRVFFILTSREAEANIRASIKRYVDGCCGVHWDGPYEG